MYPTVPATPILVTVKETPSAAGAELQVEAVSSASKKKTTATITLVKEAGAWKLEGESWKGSM